MANTCKPKPARQRKRPFTVTRRLFAWAVLHHAGLPHNPAQMRCLVAVMAGENSLAHWNPMDTTLHEAGAVPYNTFGEGGQDHVWDYPSAEAGVQATVDTMLQANMGAWVEVLRRPNVDAADCAQAFARVQWAYKGDRVPLDVVGDWATGRRSYIRDRAVEIPGPGGWPYAKRIP